MTNGITAGRAVLLGVATGGRSTAGLTALAVGGPRWARLTTGVLATGEVVADKLPTTPSRLDPGPLAGRAVLGGVAGALLARRYGEGWQLPAALGAVGAVAGSWLGSRYRSIGAAHGIPDVVSALLEDAAVVALAGAAVR